MTTALASHCVELPWDTEFWGLNIGRAGPPTLAADECARASGLDCLFLLVPIGEMGEAHDAVRAGFRLTDVRVQFELEPQPRPSYHPRLHAERDLDAIEGLARRAFRGTRFYNDPRFPDERCDDLYAAWAHASCAGEATVLVAEREHRFAGFVTITGEGEIGLIAVDPWARRQGVGSELMGGALDWAWQHDLERVTVVTQGGNMAAQRLFQWAGGRSCDVALWFHKWYDNPLFGPVVEPPAIEARP